MSTSYRASPFFDFYIEEIEGPILKNHEFLIDLNTELTEVILKILGIKTTIAGTSTFIPLGTIDYDFRYRITPKRQSDFRIKEYTQVFNYRSGFISGLSILDLLFNMGPDSLYYL